MKKGCSYTSFISINMVPVSVRRENANSARLAQGCQFRSANFLAGRADQAARVQPAAVHQPHLQRLPRVEAGEGAVQHADVQPAVAAGVLVAAGSPVLPLTNLLTTALLPHLVRVVEAARVRRVPLQREVAVGT